MGEKGLFFLGFDEILLAPVVGGVEGARASGDVKTAGVEFSPCSL